MYAHTYTHTAGIRIHTHADVRQDGVNGSTSLNMYVSIYNVYVCMYVCHLLTLDEVMVRKLGRTVHLVHKQEPTYTDG